MLYNRLIPNNIMDISHSSSNNNMYEQLSFSNDLRTMPFTTFLEQQGKNEFFEDFILYLHQTYCIENLYFWQHVQRYIADPTWLRFEDILDTFILVNSPYEINIPCELREAILSIRTNNLKEIKYAPSDCFDTAAELVLELLRVNSFLPWSNDFYNNKYNTTSGSKRSSAMLSSASSCCTTTTTTYSSTSVSTPKDYAHHPQQRSAILSTANKKNRLSAMLTPSLSFPVHLYSSPSMSTSSTTFAGISRPSFCSFRSLAVSATTTTSNYSSAASSFFDSLGAKSHRLKDRFVKMKERILSTAKK